ncbi:MAG: hypothetical protein RMK19_09210, partial [Bacteroidia bacterium]|nr:hypothetical protein [Bacteroidia bacterium]
MRTFLLIGLGLLGYLSYAQCNYNMQNSQTVNLSTANCCSSANFYDSGGSSGNYNNNEDLVMTFLAASSQRLYADFVSFSLAAGDTLWVYDGNSTSAPLRWLFTGTALPPDISSEGNALT